MRGLTAFASIGGLLATASAASPAWRTATTNDTAPESVYHFANITVSKKLSWVKCFDNFTCANLEVPLDYANESAGTTNIAFIKYQGGDGSGPDILFNPGGPGGSGVSSIIEGGSTIHARFGGNYNLVGFDPRGVNNSGPTLTCFPEDRLSRTQFNIFSRGNMNAPPGERYQLTRASGERCAHANANTDAKYSGTSAVAQDLNYYIHLNAALKNQTAGEAKFYYYGASYGTVIGQTLAAMYPEKIERMVLDGNVYAEQYYNGNVRNAVADTDAAVRSFFAYCAQAGPEKCAFATENASAIELELRYKNILQKLEDEPLVVSGLDQLTPSVVTRSDLERFTFGHSYRPLTQFPILARVLNEIDSGNSSTYNRASALASSWSEEEGLYNSEVPNPDFSSGEALRLITCIDVAGRFNVTREEYTKLLREFKEMSYYGASLGRSNALFCAGFEITPPESQFFPGFKETQTKTPILFINTLRDPITPYSSAVMASKFFPGSVVLAQDTTGHCFPSVPSNCTLEHYKKYWETAELPEEGTTCEGNVVPIVDPLTIPGAPVEEEEEDVEALLKRDILLKY